MAGLISIKQLVFLSAVQSLRRAGDRMETSALNVDTGDFNSPALTRYMDNFEEIRQMIALYQTIIREDAGALREISDQFDSFDRYLASLWRGH